MDRIKAAVAFFAIVLSQRTAVVSASSYVDVSLNGCSDGSIAIDSIAMDCDGDYCSWGSRATFSGTYTLTDDLSSSDTSLKVTASALGVTVYDGSADICRGVESTTGTSCPSAGTYSFSTRETLPLSSDAWYSSISGGWLSVKIKASFQDLGSTCTFQVKVKKAGYSMTRTASIVGAGVAIVGAIVTLAMRKRRVATINLNAEEGEATSHFEMMDGVRV